VIDAISNAIDAIDNAAAFIKTFGHYPLTTESLRQAVEGLQSLQNRGEADHDALNDLWACAESGYSLDDLKAKIKMYLDASTQPVVPEGFTKWLSAFVEVSNLSGIEDHEIAWTWPSPPNAPEFFANYPALTTGDLRELHALHLAVPPKFGRNDLIELLIATRNQSEGVTADLIIKLLSAGKGGE